MAVPSHPMSALRGTDAGRALMASVRAHKKGPAVIPATTRKTDATKGAAEPDGSYPIRNPVDLKNAINDWGRAGAKPSDKAFIVERARTLGLLKQLPESWGVPDGDSDADDAPKSERHAAIMFAAKRRKP